MTAPLNAPKRTPELVARVKELRAQGMTQLQIAAEVGVSHTTVRNALRRGPGISSDERKRASRDLWRDQVFGGEDRRIWTRERVIAAIRAWEKRTGKPPTAFQWGRPNGAGWNFTARRASRPSLPTVFKLFGSWNGAIEAAGFPTRQEGWHGSPRRDGRCRNGHVVAVVGLRNTGRCAECARINARRYYRRKREREKAATQNE